MDEIRRNFENLIMALEIPENLPYQEENKFHSDIFMHCWNITPPNLFRYRSCSEYHIEAFKNDQLSLTKPTKFNDPYDALLFIDKKKILAEINAINKDKSYEHISKLISDTEFRNQETKRFGQAFIEKIIYNATDGGRPLMTNDKYIEFQKKHNEHRLNLIIDLAIKSLKQSSLVACLSENIDSILMWSHYSSNHTGFALNYDFKALYSIDIGSNKTKGSEFVDKKLFPVIYKDERYNATYYAEFHFIADFYRRLGLQFTQPFYDKLFYYKSLIFKSKNWEYENEWRIIKQTNIDLDDNKPDYIYIENIKPKEIYLGRDISLKDKSTLLEIAKRKKIKVFQMEIDTSEMEYKLKYNEVK